MEAIAALVALVICAAVVAISHFHEEAKRERRRADEIEKYGEEQKRRAGDPFD